MILNSVNSIFAIFRLLVKINLITINVNKLTSSAIYKKNSELKAITVVAWIIGDLPTIFSTNPQHL